MLSNDLKQLYHINLLLNDLTLLLCDVQFLHELNVVMHCKGSRLCTELSSLS